jgi:O-acetylserine/cysteine efflux transporter
VTAAPIWAIANIQIKEMGEVNGFALNAWVSLFGAFQLLLASLLFESGQWQAFTQAGWLSWAAILYMSVLVTIVGYGLSYYLMNKYEVNQTMPFTLLVPVFGVLSGVLFLGEPLTWRMIAGGALTIAGVGVIVVRRPRLVDPQAEASCT